MKSLFSNKKYPIAIQTRLTQIVKVYFLFEKINFNGLLSTPTQTNFYPIISLLHIKSEQKLIRK